VAKTITTATGTGTVVSVLNTTNPQFASTIGETYSISVTLDGGSETLMETTRTKPSVKVGDRVSVTVTDGPMGRLMSEVTKIA